MTTGICSSRLGDKLRLYRKQNDVLSSLIRIRELNLSFQSNSLLANYTDALIDELKDTNITPTSLVPGITDTDFFNQVNANETKVNKTSSADNPRDVSRCVYDAFFKGEHRAYGSTKVKLMVEVGNLIPNELIVKSTRSFMEE